MRDRNRLAAWRAAAGGAWAAFWPSRLVVFGVGIWVTIAGFIPNAVPETPQLGHPFGGWPAHHLLDLVLSPMAKWDAQHYLAIAWDGYVEGHAGLPPAELRPAFFPLYPGAVRVLSGFGASPGAVLIAAYAISLACFFGALVLLHRLTEIELGERYARPTLMLFAFFPTAMFFGIPYTESLFVLLAVGAFLAARTGEWDIAGICLGLLSATRVPGLLVVVPVALLYLYGPRSDREPGPRRGIRPRYAIRPDAAWLLLAPAGLIAYTVYLHFALHNGFAWNDAQALFGRHNVDPFTGAWAGIREAGKGLAHIVDGSYQGTYDYLNVAQLVFVVFAFVGGIGLLRTMPVAYGAWVLVSLVPILIAEQPQFPFFSAMRFVVVLFPLFMWLAVVCERRGWTTRVVALFAAGMAICTAQFALWSFVA